jgi:hypothetical protein
MRTGIYPVSALGLCTVDARLAAPRGTTGLLLVGAELPTAGLPTRDTHRHRYLDG